jgi:hypothetical protein
LGEARRPAAKLREILGRGRNIGQAARREGFLEDHELIRIGVRQRMQQHGISRGEDGNVRSNCKRQREHRDDAEPGTLQKLPECELKILRHIFYRREFNYVPELASLYKSLFQAQGSLTPSAVRHYS